MRVSLTISCAAQVPASHLRDVIRDRSRVVAPRIAISTCHSRTAQRAGTTSDALGLFAHLSPPPGDCMVSVEDAAFRTPVLSRVERRGTDHRQHPTGNRPINGGPRGGGDRDRRPDLGCGSGARHRKPHCRDPAPTGTRTTTWAIFEVSGRRLSWPAHYTVSAALGFLIEGSGEPPPATSNHNLRGGHTLLV